MKNKNKTRNTIFYVIIVLIICFLSCPVSYAAVELDDEPTTGYDNVITDRPLLGASLASEPLPPPSPIELNKENIKKYSVVTPALLSGGFAELSELIGGYSTAFSAGCFVADYMLDNPLINAGELSLVTPVYSVWQGKQLICYRLEDLIEHEILVECTFIHVDQPLEPSASIVTYDGIDYAPNAVNIAIYREDGSVNRYYITNSKNYSSKYTYSTSQITWSNSTGCNIVSVSGTGQNYSNVVCGDFAVKFPEVNSIRNVLWLEDDTHKNYITGFYNSDTGNNNLVNYISDFSILRGSVNMKVEKVNSQAWDLKQGNFKYYYASWFDSNNSRFNDYYADKRQFTYNSYFVGGTTINNSNYNDYYNGAFSPLFNPDIDWSLPEIDVNSIISDLIPDISASLKSSLDWHNLELESDISNYLQIMPDFGYPWGTGGQNNYLDIEFPVITTLTDSGGTSVTPTYSAYDESTNIIATYPTLPTNTLPQNFIDKAKDVFQGGYNFMNALGLIAIIIPVALFGILWKFTGG